jgi:hypothetical protein
MELCLQQLQKHSEPCGQNWSTPIARDYRGRTAWGKTYLPDQINEEEIKDLENIHVDINEDVYRLKDLDHCIIGVNSMKKFIYSYERLVQHFTAYLKLDDAIDHVYFNILSITHETTFQVVYDET